MQIPENSDKLRNLRDVIPTCNVTGIFAYLTNKAIAALQCLEAFWTENFSMLALAF